MDEFKTSLLAALEKVDSFFLQQEKVAKGRFKLLSRQVELLEEHERRPDRIQLVGRRRFCGLKGPSVKTVKANLCRAFAELYRFLGLLRSYRELNITAVRKITKKFDKNMVLQTNVGPWVADSVP